MVFEPPLVSQVQNWGNNSIENKIEVSFNFGANDGFFRPIKWQFMVSVAIWKRSVLLMLINLTWTKRYDTVCDAHSVMMTCGINLPVISSYG